jgi:hypothetical protein
LVVEDDGAIRQGIQNGLELAWLVVDWMSSNQALCMPLAGQAHQPFHEWVQGDL